MDNPTGKRLLIVDDTAEYRHSLRIYLEIENYQVEEADSVVEANNHLDRTHFDLILLDLRLTNHDDNHDFSAWEVARKAGEIGIPCIMITAYSSVEVERVFLNSRNGEPMAMDFIEKKDGPLAILGAVQAVLSKKREIHEQEEPGLVIDLARGLVTLKGEQIKLSQKQYDLLSCLVIKNGAVTSHSEIMKAVYGEILSDKEAKVDPRLERMVERVREKIKDDSTNPHYLITVKGRGYRLILGGEEEHPQNPPG